MNRLFTQLSAASAFEQASLGLQEWLALSALQGDAPLNNKQMVRHLGLAPNRTAQIVDSETAEKNIFKGSQVVYRFNCVG